MNKVDLVEHARLRTDIPPFRPGDQVKVHVKVTEGQRERVQVFEGIVLARRGGGLRESFTVRKISFGVGVERTFPLHTPSIDKIEVVRHGKVRRAKLYYLRERIGRRAKIEERRTRIQEWTPELAEPEGAAGGEGDAAPAESTAEEAPAAVTEEPAVEEAASDTPAEEPPKESSDEEAPEAQPTAAAEEPPAEEPPAEEPPAEEPDKTGS